MPERFAIRTLLYWKCRFTGLSMRPQEKRIQMERENKEETSPSNVAVETLVSLRAPLRSVYIRSWPRIREDDFFALTCENEGPAGFGEKFASAPSAPSGPICRLAPMLRLVQKHYRLAERHEHMRPSIIHSFIHPTSEGANDRGR
jgi:hypothetical protein